MPIRTCIVTGKKSEQSAFFRFTLQNTTLIPDTHQKNKGRGVYVSKTIQALEKLPRLHKKIIHSVRTKEKTIHISPLEDLRIHCQ
jgi:predicted RNA-binding protein YlxR (DUF448 family)